MNDTDLVRQFGSPLYVYEERVIRERCRELRRAFTLDNVELLYAMKANPAPAILAIVADEGFGIDAVSIGEVRCALGARISPQRISWTGNNATEEELRAVAEADVHPTLDSISQMIRWSRVKPGSAVGLRINPDLGSGHHDHVITGGPDSKFGESPQRVEDAIAAANKLGLTLDTLQQHIGSGILDVNVLLSAMKVLLEIAPTVPDLRVVDFGGGFGIPYRPQEAPFDLATFGYQASGLLDRHDQDLTFRFEPGRYVVGPAGTLYVTVTDVKRTRQHTWVGTDSGLHHLLRPALYGAYHHVENVSHPEAAPERVSVVGNICESGDVLAREISLPRAEEDDILAIRDTGAYGASMSSNYNLRPRPAEVLLSQDGAPRLIRRRETIEDLLRLYS